MGNKNKYKKIKKNIHKKEGYKVSKDKTIELLKLIKDNPNEIVGLCEDYWNKNVLGISYDEYNSKYTNIRPCVFDKQIMYGTDSTPKEGGCYYRCGVSYLNDTLEFKKEYIDRYIELLQSDYYANKNFLNLKRLNPLITSKEEDFIEDVKDKLFEEFEERMKIEAALDLKTDNDRNKNIVVIHGSNKDNLPQELYDGIAKIIDSLEYAPMFYGVYENKISIWDDYNCVIEKKCTISNCSISMSVYYDYAKECKFFGFAIDDYPIECNSIELNDELDAFYKKWKDFKEFNKDRYNEPYKKSMQEKDEDYLNSISSLECEVCIFSSHCNGLFCLKPEGSSLKSLIQKEIEESITEEYVINLHILEACNFRCKYCFAHFDYMTMLPVNIWKHIVDNVANSMYVRRFNIAGGEPLLYPHLEELMMYIKEKGFEVSIITNGFLLSEEFITRNKDIIDCIGISVDSFDKDTLIELDCKTNKGEFLDKERFISLCRLINQFNIDLKINTVVSKSNWDQDMSEVLNSIVVDRWKILKMKIFKNDKFDNSYLDIDIDKFNHFVNRHKDIVRNTVVEDTLKNSYIMIDSEGCLVDNSGDKYEKLINVANENFIDGFKKLSFDKDLYFSRYKKYI